MLHRSRTPRFALAMAISLTFVAAACGSSSSDSSDTTAADKTTTTKPAATTTTDAPGGDAPTTADLEDILPAVSDIGDGWKLDPDADASRSAATEKAIADQCPAAATLVNSDPDESDQAKIAFIDGDSRRLSVTLSPSAEAVSDADLKSLVSAINECPEVAVTENGTTTTFKFQAAEDTDHGDQGIRLQADIKLEDASFPKPVSVTFYGLTFRTGSVGVKIGGFDGVKNDGTAVPADTDQLVTVADSINTQVHELVGN